MSEFQPLYPDATTLDPHKRVKYTHGLVLGVDEFNQEELYLLEKQRLHNRALHGYGTLCGLKVTVEEDSEEPGRWKLLIAPGIALDAQGREIRIPEAQCADLSIWVLNHRVDILRELDLIDVGSPPVIASPPIDISPPAPLNLYLVLCYRQCDTDFVPVPSGPCQTQDKTSVPSRTADDFKLSLEFNPPEHREEHKLRELIDLLQQIEISSAPGGLTEADLEPLVNSILSEDSPPVFSPPIGDLHMRPEEAEYFIRTALRIWVTEVRSGLEASERNCSAGPIDEECVLLGQLEMSIEDTDAGLRIVGEVTLDQQQRPFLLQTRLLQEQILQCCNALPSTLIGSPSSVYIDETNFMHLTGDETVEGQKTFTDPVAFGSDGRFRKRIQIAPMTGLPVDTALVTPDFFPAQVPALRFEQGGEASFTIPVPDDIDFSVPPRVRLVWGIRETPDVTVDYDWQINNRYAGTGLDFGGLAPASIVGTQTDAHNGRVYITDYTDLGDDSELDDILGVIKIHLNSVNPAIGIYLLQVEVEYAANRLGRDF